ncbi:substrate-binding domain-containing protein [Bremerella sp. JC770]|uniref:substrate-binding domain-containing protein n=1 Tax=Bremerella sp. JC770 TaxID=3232137 RepID=UPI00345777B8
MNGVLRYIEEEPSLQIRDFRYSVNDRHLSGDPPWKGKVDGVIVNMSNSPEVVPWLERGGAPVVSTTGDLLGTTIPCVGIDDESLARLSAKHAIESGYRQVAFVGRKEYAASHRRRAALESEFKKLGMDLQSVEIDKIPRAGYDQDDDGTCLAAIGELLERLSTRTLVIGINDFAAAAVVKLASELGLKIPEQIGVLGVGDADITRISDPPISSVRVDREQIGYQSAKNLHRILQGIDIGQTANGIPVVDIVARQSTLGIIQNLTTDIDHAIAFIERHALEGIRLQDVADAVHVPLRTLELDFKRGTGRTMGEMIQQLRLERAKQLLETTDLSTQRIATLIGFTHYSTLSRMTVRMIGMTPSQYRQQYRDKSSS